MSYFVFGLIDLTAGEKPERLRTLAPAQGMDVKLGDDVRQPILSEMIGSYAPETSVPFMLTRSPEEDTSDSLISPYVVGVEASAQAFALVGSWLIAALESPAVERIHLWMTEGYDSSFENLEVSANGFADEVQRRVLAEDDVPSLHLSVVR